MTLGLVLLQLLSPYPSPSASDKNAFSSRLSVSDTLEELCAEGSECSKIYWCAKQIIDLGNIN